MAKTSMQTTEATTGMLPEPNSRFIKVRCQKCKNEQIIFGKPSTKVLCLVCGKSLSSPAGGKGHIKGRVLEVLS